MKKEWYCCDCPFSERYDEKYHGCPNKNKKPTKEYLCAPARMAMNLAENLVEMCNGALSLEEIFRIFSEGIAFTGKNNLPR